MARLYVLASRDLAPLMNEAVPENVPLHVRR
jgi:hypothetical protein